MRAGHEEWAAQVDGKRLVFVDESGVHTSMTRTYARSQSGRRISGKVPRNRGSVLTVLGGMRPSGESTFETIRAGTSCEVFEAFVQKVLVPFLRSGDIVVWDNLAAHKSKRVREFIEGVGARIHWQPPYTPQANAIELFWGWMKARLRSLGARTREAVEAGIAAAADALTPQIAQGWVRHCGYVV